MGEWFYYNFAAGSFHTKQLCRRLHSTKVDFDSKITKNRFFSYPLGDFGGNVCTLSITRWKARGRLPIRYNWTYFAIPHG